jgi:S-(hydroxymethyl)glutathione dehydrogenase / alcohol dehydrogenase
MKAKAAVSDGNGSFSIEEIDVADPGNGEVLVQIKASGVCHTDYDSMRWGRPLVMGHEGAGIVLRIGSNIRSVAPGDHVLLNWAMPCGHCFQCENGNRSICENYSPVTGAKDARGLTSGHPEFRSTTFQGKAIERSFNIGTLSQYTIVKEEAIVKMPSDIPFASACILGCGVMTGYGSAVNAAKVSKGSSVAVLGAGGVGLNVIQGCRIAGAAKIISLDLSPVRLELSKKFGATHVIRVSKEAGGMEDAYKKVKALTSNRGADYAFECTGNPKLGAAPLALVRNAGMALQVSGIEEEITIDMNLFEWDKIYLNPLYGKCNPPVDFPKLFDLYKGGELLLDELVSKTYALEDLSLVIDDMLNGRIAKGVVLF